jgi:hypothetical protein
MRVTRVFSVVFQMGAAVAALGIGSVSVLLLMTLPRMAANTIQKGLMAVVAVSFAVSGMCWVLKFRTRYLAWLANGVWPGDDDRQSPRWARLALIGWISGLVSLGILSASFLAW